MKLNYLLIPYIAVLGFMFGGILIGGGIEWYSTLALPSWHPPTELIAVIWAGIYFTSAWSLLIVWNKTEHDSEFPWVMGGYLFCLLLNLAWSILWFRLHMLEASVWCAVILGLAVLLLAMLVVVRAPKAAVLLVPYVVWVFFAAYLNHAVAMLN